MINRIKCAYYKSILAKYNKIVRHKKDNFLERRLSVLIKNVKLQIKRKNSQNKTSHVLPCCTLNIKRTLYR